MTRIGSLRTIAPASISYATREPWRIFIFFAPMFPLPNRKVVRLLFPALDSKGRTRFWRVSTENLC